MQRRRLGTTGPLVSEIGLGAMGMSDMYGPADRAESIATVHAALDAGVSLIDTGDFYGMGHNEMLLAEALAGKRREEVVLSVKFGAQRDPAGAWLGYDCRPVAVKSALAYTLKRLQTDYIDIYRPARLSKATPIEETVGAISELIQAGYVRHIGLSEVGPETIRRAAAVHPIVDLQIEYAVVTRDIEREILPVLRELGIGVTAYGVLGRGLFSGHWTPERSAAATGFRKLGSRFSGENLAQNLAIVERLREIADQKGISVAALAVAWTLARGSDILPLVGARSRRQLGESLEAAGVTLTPGDLASIDAAIPPEGAAGPRYAAAAVAFLDSERKAAAPVPQT